MAAPRALLLGSLPRVVLAAMRSLGRGGVRVHFAGQASEPLLLHSRYLAKAHYLPAYGPNSRWLEALMALLKREAFDLVMPCTDWETLVCHAHRQALLACALIYLPNAEAFDILVSKINTSRHARAVGVRTPRELVVTALEQTDEVVKTFHFPIVLKPQQSFQLDNPCWHQRVVKAYSAPELEAKLVDLLKLGAVVAQENFNGKGVGIEILMQRGQPLLAFQHERVHEPLHGGPSSYRKSVPLSEELWDASLRLLRPLNYSGVGMVEFRVNEQTGDWVFLEVNPRFWGSLPLTIAAGADFPLALFQLWVNGCVPASTSYRTGIHGRDLLADLGWLKNNLLADRADRTLQTRSWPRVIRDALVNVVNSRERWDAWAADDPRPGLVELMSLPRRLAEWFVAR
jgi:predicted ATP-grasp superfamily ATP-dependent carboligase